MLSETTKKILSETHEETRQKVREETKKHLLGIMVKKAVCKHGKAVLLAVIEPDTGLSELAKKEIQKAVKKGYDVITVTLEEARKSKLYFKCK